MAVAAAAFELGYGGKRDGQSWLEAAHEQRRLVSLVGRGVRAESGGLVPTESRAL